MTEPERGDTGTTGADAGPDPASGERLALFRRGTPEYRELFGVAYRLLGAVQDAEDALQEGFARWQELSEEQRALVRVPAAWLTRVIGRICLDQLGSARARRESYRGIWLPEPLLGAAPGRSAGDRFAAPIVSAPSPDPADVVTLDESVSLALLVAMEQLTPPERVSMILHDVFQVPFQEIAEIVGRTPAACRQLATSARRSIHAQRRFQVPGAARDRVVEAFARACEDGDLEALVSVLDPQVVCRADGGSLMHAARKPVEGAVKVSQYLLGVLRLQQKQRSPLDVAIEPVNGRSSLVIREAGTLVGVVDVGVVDGRVAQLSLMVNPEKLGHAPE